MSQNSFGLGSLRRPGAEKVLAATRRDSHIILYQPFVVCDDHGHVVPDWQAVCALQPICRPGHSHEFHMHRILGNAGNPRPVLSIFNHQQRDRKSTRLNSSHTEIYTLSLHDALPISLPEGIVTSYCINPSSSATITATSFQIGRLSARCSRFVARGIPTNSICTVSLEMREILAPC